MLKSLSVSFAAFLFIAGGLDAQFVVALPGTSTSGSSATAYTANTLTALNTVTAGPNSFSVLAKPDGSKYYIIANSGSNSVTVVDSGFANPRIIASFGAQATSAAITPDGTRLAIAAGTLQLIDTVADQPVGTGVNVASSAYDVAISLDGSTAFVLGQSPVQGSVLTAVDIKSATVKSSINIAGAASGVAVGPNGLVYVSTINQIVEAYYANSTLTQTNVIGLNASPTRLTFTTDGLYGAATNLTPRTGSSVQLYNLSSHTIANTVPSFGVTLDQIVALGANSFIAYSQSAQGLYTLTISSNGNFVINALTISGLPSNTINAFAISNEVGVNGGAVTNTHYLFVATASTLYKVDLNSNQVAGQVAPSFPIGAVSYAAAAPLNALPTTILPYGANQPTLKQGSGSLPLVVRLLDANGLPVNDALVTFTSSAGALTTSTQTTGSNGFAQTTLVAPAIGGPVTVTATTGSLSTIFKLQVAGSTGPGGGGNSGLTIVSGQGQLLQAFTNSGSAGFGAPLTVAVTGPDGKPAPGVKVTFSITQGTLGILGGVPTSVPGQTAVISDNNGLASVTVLTSQVLDLVNGFDTNTIIANAPNTNTVTFYESTIPINSLTPTIFLIQPAAVSTLTGSAGSVLKGGFVVKVISGTGIPMPNVSLILTNPANPTGTPAASCVDPTGAGVLSDSTGTISCDVMFSGEIGLGQVQGNVGYTRVTPVVNILVTQGLPAKVTIVDGNNQTGHPGQLLPKALLVLVTDAFGNPLPNTPVSFTVSPANGATLSKVSTVTDGNSRASAQVTLGNTSGIVKVTVTAGTATATFSLTTTVAVAGLNVVSGTPQTATVNTAFPLPLVVQAVDTSSNPVSGSVIAFAVTSGTATLSAPSVTTDNNGQASVNVTAGGTPGSIVVTATSSTFSAQFILTATAVAPPGPSNIVFVNGASFDPGASPGSIVTITGNNLVIATGILTPNSIVGGPLPTTLGGVTVSFNGTAAPIYSVSNIGGRQQVTVQVPFELSPGPVTVLISVENGGSISLPLTLTQFSPGVFTTTVDGQTIAVAIRSDGSYVTPSNAARQGENITLFLTGLGATTPPAVTGTTGLGQAVAAPVITGLNNAGVPLISAVLAPNLVGVYAVTLTVPVDTKTGPNQPIGVIVYDAANNAFFAQSTFIPIQ